MHISNVRLGFATNSSSTHSIIFCKKNAVKQFRDEDAESGDFGWNEFCCASPDSKALYLAQTLYNTLSGMIGEDMAKSVATDWCRTPPFSGGYVDHQSQMTLPVSRKTTGCHYSDFRPVDRAFFDDLMQYYMRDDLVIVGGNDNSEHTRFTTGRKKHILPTDGRPGTYVCKKDGDWWVLMNQHSGAKIRLSFLDKPKPYVRSSTPELIDIKITNYCPYGCSYCVPSGTAILTPSGEKKIEEIASGEIVYGYSHEEGRRVEVKVDQIHRRQYDGEMITIEMENGQTVSLTPNHEVYTTNRGYVEAGDLTEKDEVLEF